MRIKFIAGYGQLTNLIIAESHAFGLTQQILADIFEITCCSQLLLDIVDVSQTAKEPLVNLGQFMQLIDSITLRKCQLNSRQTAVGRINQLGLDIRNMNVVADKSVQALSDHTHTLLDSLLKGASYGHDLTYRLHAGAYQT